MGHWIRYLIWPRGREHTPLWPRLTFVAVLTPSVLGVAWALDRSASGESDQRLFGCFLGSLVVAGAFLVARALCAFRRPGHGPSDALE